MNGATALILAGRRPGGDAFATRAGVSHKALIPICGVPMIARVVRALQESGRIARMVVAIEDADALHGCSELAEPLARGEVEIVPAGISPGATVRQVLERFSGPWPLVVTTADHALLRPEMIRVLLDQAPPDADVVVGTVAAETLHAAYPEVRRTLLRFRDGGIKGANLFLFPRTAAAGALMAFWQSAEQDRKTPWRLVARIGPMTALRFVLGWLPAGEVLQRLSQLTGAHVAFVRLPFAEAALDVDDEEDQALAEQILRRRS